MPRSVALHLVASLSAELETQLGDATDPDDSHYGASADGCDQHGEPERDLPVGAKEPNVDVRRVLEHEDDQQ